MIKVRPSVCTVTDDVFDTAMHVITKARVAEQLELYYQQANRGGDDGASVRECRRDRGRGRKRGFISTYRGRRG